MSNYKISIIMPVYNAEKYLRFSLESIVSQSIGVENLEVIIVNDASTDSSKDIMEEYCLKYPNFMAIHLDNNIGAAYGPRNIALQKATSDYVMFLDADDTFNSDACEVLYDEIASSKADIVFGRYFRVYDDTKLKSYSPYFDGDNDIKINPKFNTLTSFIWSKFIYRILYGKNKEVRDKIIIDDIRKNPEILKILPSIWTKIVKKDSIGTFPELITGEDLNFILDIYNEGRLVFLNDKFITNYYMRFDGDLSITKNIKFQLVYDSIRAYKMAVLKCRKYNFRKYDKMINPFLINYINLIRQAKFNDEEMKLLLDEITEIKKVYDSGFIGKILVRLIMFLSR